MFETIGRDVRFALRGLRRDPLFAAAAIATLALGLGATTAIGSVMDALLLRPLPYPEDEALHSVWGVVEGSDRIQPSFPDFEDWRAAASKLDLAFARGEVFSVRDALGTGLVPGALVSEGFFEVLGAGAALGGTFAPEEERAGQPVVVVSHRYWVRELGGSPDAVGSALSIDGVAHAVAGVMAPGVAYPEWAELWVPLRSASVAPPALSQRGARVDHRSIGRLAPGVSEAEAEAELEAIAARLAELHPETNAGLGLHLSPLREEVLGDARPSLMVLATGVVLVLLLSAGNVALLLLARAAARGREIAVRDALGAGRRRLVSQLLTESVVLAGVGGALGLLVAGLGVRLLVATAPGAAGWGATALPRLEEVALDGRVLAFAALLTLVTGVIFGTLPALEATRGGLARRLREGAPGGGTSARSARIQSGLVVAQLALAVTLLVGAGLLARTFVALQDQHPGFRPEALVVLRVFPPPGHESPEARMALYDALRERAGGVPGVAGAALINHMPLGAGFLPTTVEVPGRAAPEQPASAAFRTVSPGFFGVAGVRVLEGRDFDSRDAVPGSGALVVNRALAASLWPEASALGQPLTYVNPNPSSERRGERVTGSVVGVVENTRESLRSEGSPALYVPHSWDAWGNTFLVVRAAGRPAALIPGLRSALRELEDDLPTAQLQPMVELIRGAVARERLSAALMVAFGGLALVLAVVGVYGALARMVVRRRRELGIRLALGARPADVRRILAVRAATLLIVGLALGAGGAWALARLMGGLLFGVEPLDPATLVATGAVLAVAAAAATWIPALRAGRLDPSAALRAD